MRRVKARLLKVGMIVRDDGDAEYEVAAVSKPFEGYVTPDRWGDVVRVTYTDGETEIIGSSAMVHVWPRRRKT